MFMAGLMVYKLASFYIKNKQIFMSNIECICKNDEGLIYIVVKVNTAYILVVSRYMQS